MRILQQMGYELQNSNHDFICKPQITIEALIEFAKKHSGKELQIHVFSENEIRLYDGALSSPDKVLMYYIIGEPKRKGCCF